MMLQMVLCQGRWRFHQVFSSFLSSTSILSTLIYFSVLASVPFTWASYLYRSPISKSARLLWKLLEEEKCFVSLWDWQPQSTIKNPWNLLDSPIAFVRSLTGGRGVANIPCQHEKTQGMQNCFWNLATLCSNNLKQMASLRIWVICPLNAHHLHLDLLL